ncbi:MAG: S-methyl-5-thioribose-1-phosphate isomerase [Thermoanaerobaculia bacterium]
MAESELFTPIRWAGDHLELLDQTRLPAEEVWLACREPEDVAAAIRRLSVRGAPAIGVAAAFGLVLGVDTAPADAELDVHMAGIADLLAATRPTAVNLSWALEQGRRIVDEHATAGAAPLLQALLAWARRLHAEDIEANRRIGEHGARLFAAGDRVLTHCNTGALATAGYGTALGVIQAAWGAGRLASVWVDETRPLLQGARLTAWELSRLGIPYRLVTDSSAGALMSRGLVDRIVVGADRVAANGDIANKIGTYTLAVLAHRHGVPFYVAAPVSTIDPDTPTGADIPIEERDAEEVRRVFGTAIAPDAADAANFAFDVTPADLVTAIITDRGVLEPPYTGSIATALVEAASSSALSGGRRG